MDALLLPYLLPIGPLMDYVAQVCKYAGANNPSSLTLRPILPDMLTIKQVSNQHFFFVLSWLLFSTVVSKCYEEKKKKAADLWFYRPFALEKKSPVTAQEISQCPQSRCVH